MFFFLTLVQSNLHLSIIMYQKNLIILHLGYLLP